jgi:hypothetical protein
MRLAVAFTSAFLVFGASADEGVEVAGPSRDADVVELLGAAHSLVIPSDGLCADSRRAFAVARTLRYARTRNDSFGSLAGLASCADPAVALEASVSVLALIASPRADWEDAMNASVRADALAMFERLADDVSRGEDVRVAARAAVEHLASP